MHTTATDAVQSWYHVYFVGAAGAPLVEHPPKDSTGRWLTSLDWKVAVGAITIDVPGKKRLGDCLNVVGGDDIISPRAYKVIGELRVHENVTFRDIVVVRSALDLREKWHWMASGGDIDVVDWDRSVIIKSPLDPGRGMVYRGVLDRKKLPPCDIFYGNTSFLYVNDVLRRRFEEAGLIGFSFEKVEVV
jgi:hypothetical protein